jgi:hypothetical protein
MYDLYNPLNLLRGLLLVYICVYIICHIIWPEFFED